MKVPHLNLVLSAALVTAGFCAVCPGQAAPAPGKNNPYSPSPSGRTAVQSARVDRSMDGYLQPKPPEVERVSFVVKETDASLPKPADAVVKKEEPYVAPAVPARPPTETYLIGVGDVLLINLKNSPHGTGKYVVREDGTIDFALAGSAVSVRRKTAEEVASILRGAVKIFANPQVDVKVIEYRSHTVEVSGLADNTGEKSLRREAMPLFTLRAEAEVSNDAKRVAITRAGTTAVDTYDLTDPRTDLILVFPGDSIEFLAGPVVKSPVVEHFILNGAVASPGKKELPQPITLSKAIAAAGGGDGAKRASIKRANEKGTLIATEYDLKAIRSGKTIDPFLAPGDVVEVRN